MMKYWKTGAVRLACEELRAHIAGKRIGLMMNTSAVDNEGRLLVDRIVEEKWAEVAFFFGMEHGIRGNLYAGSGDQTDIDEKTGIPIISMYKTEGHRPPVDVVRQVDAVIFCAQDTGIRHWTYIPWMIELVEACAKADREVIILDRPNPIRGDIVEGAAGDKYIGMAHLSGFDYPLRHGLTIGELAHMYNEEKKIGANLTVMRMQGWKRDMWYEDTGLMWLPPSPNIPTADTALFFGAVGLMQASNLHLGIKTATPFQYVGHPEISGEALAQELNSRDLDGIYFVPKFYMSAGYLESGRASEPQLCDGVMMVIEDKNAWRPVKTQLHIMDAFMKLYPGLLNLEHSPKLARIRMCTDLICDVAQKGESMLPVLAAWEQGAAAFEERRKPYLLY